MTHFLKKNALNVISLELMRILVSILTINGNKSTILHRLYCIENIKNGDRHVGEHN